MNHLTITRDNMNRRMKPNIMFITVLPGIAIIITIRVGDFIPAGTLLIIHLVLSVIPLTRTIAGMTAVTIHRLREHRVHSTKAEQTEIYQRKRGNQDTTLLVMKHWVMKQLLPTCHQVMSLQ